MTEQRQPAIDLVEGPSDPDLDGLPAVVAQIVATMQDAKLDHLILTKGDFHLELTAGRMTLGESTVTPVATGPDGAGTGPAISDETSHVIPSPMIGTFYVAPAPGEPPFVQPGDSVEPDQVIGIVEAMKVMNEIAADRAGTVIEIIAEDGETVEYGSPLIRLRIQT